MLATGKPGMGTAGREISGTGISRTVHGWI